MLADAILFTHFAFVLFITLGLPLIYLGAARGWPWVRDRRWRALHLAAILFVAAETMLGFACPLTVWEDALRGHRPGVGFLERWIQRIMFYDLPAWVFLVAYAGFAVLVAVTWALVPPAATRRPRGHGRVDAQPPATASAFALIARHFAPLARGFPGAYGLLDDAAVISPVSGGELVVKTDPVVGGVDFPSDAPAALVARKALRVNLSDLAAKGAVPRAYLLDLLLPASVDEPWIAAFAAGLAADQAEFGVHLIGGDLSSTPGPIAIAVCALGEAPVGRIIRRGGAQPHDLVYVTGTIGDAALGLGVLRGALPALDAGPAAFLLDRYRLPQPRVALGPHLIGLATAAIDVSDGLVADLRHLCEVSRLSAVIEARSVPLSPAARVAIGDDPRRLATALTGGDDYEILFTAPPAAAARIDECSRATGIAITLIGRMEAPPAAAPPRVTVLGDRGEALQFLSEGWTHFGRR